MSLPSLPWPLVIGSVYLRPLLPSDVDSAYLSWFYDPLIQKYISFANDSVTQKDLISYINQRSCKDDCLFLGIFSNKEGFFIGTVKLEPIDLVASSAELGILIGSSRYRGKGLGRFVLSELIHWLPNALGISRLTLGVSKTNFPAIRLYTSLGFVVTSSSEYSCRMEIHLSC